MNKKYSPAQQYIRDLEAANRCMYYIPVRNPKEKETIIRLLLCYGFQPAYDAPSFPQNLLDMEMKALFLGDLRIAITSPRSWGDMNCKELSLKEASRMMKEGLAVLNQV